MNFAMIKLPKPFVLLVEYSDNLKPKISENCQNCNSYNYLCPRIRAKQLNLRYHLSYPVPVVREEVPLRLATETRKSTVDC